MNEYKCQNCGSTNIGFVEYDYTCPEHYDGWSEIYCLDCGKRHGRWSNKELQDGELETLEAMRKFYEDRKLEIDNNGKKYRYNREGFEAKEVDL